jgi:ribokinase
MLNQPDANLAVKRKPVFVVGSFVAGVTVRVPRCPEAGETLAGDLFDLGPGGKGTNQAVTVARLGGDTSILGRLGDDLFGQMAIDLYKAEGIDYSEVKSVSGEHTGCGIVTLTPNDNRIALYPGANLRLTIEDVRHSAEKIRQSAVVLAQLEIPIEAVVEAMLMGKQGNACTILNPAPAQPLPDKIWPLIDIITPNETEARILTGRSPSDRAPVEQLAAELRQRGVKTVIITRGAEGVVIFDDKGVRHVPAPTIKLLDPTGAGDTFNGVLAAMLAEGKSLDEAVGWAVLGGAWCARHLGVINGIPTWETLVNFRDEVARNQAV